MKTVLSPCRLYRYTLWREWGDMLTAADGTYLMVVGLNPSTADETLDDPTIRRCVAFAKRWGHTGLLMTNLFAYRSSDPAVMKAAAEPIGEENNNWLMVEGQRAGMVLAAWGAHGSHNGRAEEVMRYMRAAGVEMRCLKKNADGSPQHPLYVAGDTVPVPFP